MNNYYDRKLHGNNLKRCYDIAPARIKQYLDAEVQYVLDVAPPRGRILELGCGYGRMLAYLAKGSRTIFGIDISTENLTAAAQMLHGVPDCYVFTMNALRLGFRDNTFDCVICIQNGISAFKVDQRSLIQESIRVAKNGGRIFFSSYSDKIWPARIHWFKLQSEEGLIGDIDWQKTRDGVIVCKDGFSASTIGVARFQELTADLPVSVITKEVDESSVFCVLTVRKNART